MRSLWLLMLVVLAAMTVTGCAAVAGIFKAGMWVGVVMVVVVLMIVGFIAAKIRS